MPQMAPYNWLFLFIYFNLLIMWMMTHNHFSYNLMHSKKNSNFKNNFINWLW